MVIGTVTISFDQTKFLEEAISSVTVSTGNELEYVVVDPGSTEDSHKIIARHSGG